MRLKRKRRSVVGKIPSEVHAHVVFDDEAGVVHVADETVEADKMKRMDGQDENSQI